MKKSFIYIIASQRNGTLYIGVTSNLEKRIYEHKNNLIKGFAEKYNVHRLVYVEEFSNIKNAFLREKQLKKWKRRWKLKLIEKFNPEWKDLYEVFLGLDPCLRRDDGKKAVIPAKVEQR